jgi:opacity protein-like surface antigen
MKTKFLVPLLALVLFSVTAMAQRTPFLQAGIKAGVNFTKVDGKSFSDEFRYGYHLGGFVQIKLAEKWQLQPEVLFNQYNTRVDTTLSDVIHTENFKNVTLNYLSIPLLLSYSPTKLISFQAGPQFGVLLDKNKNLFQNGKDAFKSGDLSLLGGVQLNLSNFRISGRYFIGLADINDATNSDKWKNQGFQVSVGLRII